MHVDDARAVPRTVGDLSLRAARRRVPLEQPSRARYEDRLRSNSIGIMVSEPLQSPVTADADLLAAKRLPLLSKPRELMSRRAERRKRPGCDVHRSPGRHVFSMRTLVPSVAQTRGTADPMRTRDKPSACKERGHGLRLRNASSPGAASFS